MAFSKTFIISVQSVIFKTLFKQFIILKLQYNITSILPSVFIRAEGLIARRSASGCLFAAVFFYLQNHFYLNFSAEKLAAGE